MSNLRTPLQVGRDPLIASCRAKALGNFLFKQAHLKDLQLVNSTVSISRITLDYW